MDTTHRTGRSGGRGRRIALAAATVLAIGALASPAAAQVRVGGFTGAFDRGAGSHPQVFLAVGGRLGVRVHGPVSVELEALHVPARLYQREMDLFAYRGSLSVEIPVSPTIRPFVLAGAGFGQWRSWLCEGTSCEPGGDGRKFDYAKGLGLTAGAGARFHGGGPLWFRMDARLEHSAFEAPANDNLLGTLGVELTL